MVDEWIEQEAWEGRGEVEVPRRSAPVGRLLFDNVVDEAGQLGPEGPALPEEAVDGDREGETDERTQNAGRNDGMDWEADVWSKVEVERLRCEEDGDLGAEDDAGHGEESKSGSLAPPAGSSGRISTGVREEVARGQRR